jgi:Tfp pilus assembly protein PilX
MMRSSHSTTSRSNRRGMALMLVILAMGVASILAMALLSAASIEAEVNANSVQAISADSLAESGVAIAMYYLQYPAKAPSLGAGNFYTGQTGIKLDPSSSDTIDVSVVSLGSDNFKITSVGHSVVSSSSKIDRTLVARVYVNAIFVVDKAVSFKSDFVLPNTMTVTGDARSDGLLTVAAPATISGNVMSSAKNGITNWTALPSYPKSGVPSYAELTLPTALGIAGPSGRPVYNYPGGTGEAQQLLVTTVAAALIGDARNPANVWYTNQNITISTAVITGTIVVTGTHSVTVTGINIIRPVSGMPGLIVSGDLKFSSLLTKSLIVQGVCWIGGDIKSASGVANNCTLQVAALMMPTASTIDANKVKGVINCAYNANQTNVTDLSSTNRIPQYVRVLGWGE